jgi:hypothetical protein
MKGTKVPTPRKSKPQKAKPEKRSEEHYGEALEAKVAKRKGFRRSKKKF